jgi:ABC-type branched-subunit amino acid transport system permease subunit
MRASLILSSLCIILLVLFPLVAPLMDLSFYVSASSLNLILGYGGMAALGHAAFFGAGAFVVAILSAEGVTTALIAWPVAVLVTAGLALLVGLISLRTRGVYFIMITLAFAQMIYYIFVSLRKYGGDDSTLRRMQSYPGSISQMTRSFTIWCAQSFWSACMSCIVSSRQNLARRCRAFVKMPPAWKPWAIQ